MNDSFPHKKRKIDYVDDVLLSCSVESILLRLQTLEQERKNGVPFPLLSRSIYFCDKLCFELIQHNNIKNEIRNKLIHNLFVLCNIDLNNKNNNVSNNINKERLFPGCMPRSLSKQDLTYIKENEYVLCEKSDGFRYFMVCTTIQKDETQKKQNICFLLDREMNITIVQIGWIDSKIYEGGTILDGELIQTKKDNQWKFRIFDVICVAGCKEIKNKPYRKRMEKWTQILEKVYCSNVMDTLLLETKELYKTTEINRLFCDMESHHHFDHGIDGIVFVPNADPVYLNGGTQKNLFKWKDNVEHTIDFVIRKKGKTEYVLYVMVQDFQPREIERKAHLVEDTESKLLDLLPVLPWESNLKRFNTEKEIVVECKYYEPLDGWVPVKYRSDKKLPNGYRTLMGTLDTIKNPISKKDLLSFLK